MAGIIFGATMLLLLPLTLMSVFTPFAVRLLLVSVKFGGRSSAMSMASPPSATCSARW